MKSIVVVGSMIYDFVTYADRLPQKGETVLGKTFGMFTGGKGANQAVQSGLLGAETYMIGRVGHDFMGDRIKDALIKSGVHIEYIVTENEKSTGCCCIHVDKHGDNAIIIVPNASTACSDEDVNAAADLFKRGNILLIQLETNYKVVLYSMKKAKEAGMQIILNPAPCQPVTDDIFEMADYFTPNETEAEYYSGFLKSDYDTETWLSLVAQALHKKGVSTLIITLGDKGAYYSNMLTMGIIDSYQIEGVDSTAAGDAFNAAFAVAIIEKMELKDAIQFANAAGALCASKIGAQVSLCNRAELGAFMKQKNVRQEKNYAEFI